MDTKEQAAMDTLSNQVMSDRTLSNGRKQDQEEEKKEVNKKDLEREKRQAALKKKRAQTAKQMKNIEAKITNMKHTSRWLPDSAITTYFGKPAFHPYGHANTNPTVGGTIYG